MLYSSLIIAHIAGACLSGIGASYTGVVLWQRTSHVYKTCALILTALAAFEIVSGVALAVVSIQISAQSLCTNIALYLSIIFCIEALLFIRMKKVSMPFPLIQTLIPVAASLVLMFAAISYGF